MYDPVIGRWNVIDPFADAYANYTPYAYVRNNPVLRVDPSSKWDITVHAFKDHAKYGYGIALKGGTGFLAHLNQRLSGQVNFQREGGMESKQNSDKILLELTKEESLVLLDWISRFNEGENSDLFNDQAEERRLLELWLIFV